MDMIKLAIFVALVASLMMSSVQALESTEQHLNGDTICYGRPAHEVTTDVYQQPIYDRATHEEIGYIVTLVNINSTDKLKAATQLVNVSHSKNGFPYVFMGKHVGDRDYVDQVMYVINSTAVAQLTVISNFTYTMFAVEQFVSNSTTGFIG